MRSSPQVGFSLAISTISFCNSAGTRGRPRGFDFHLQNSRKPFRCHRMKVSGWTIVRARRHANRRESSTRVSRLASLARRALTLRSRYRANCLRRKRFSAARAQCGRRLSLMNLRASSNRWSSRSAGRTENRVLASTIRSHTWGVTWRYEIGTDRIIADARKGGRKTDLVFSGLLVEELAYWTVVVCWSDGARLTSHIPVADG